VLCKVVDREQRGPVCKSSKRRADRSLPIRSGPSQAQTRKKLIEPPIGRAVSGSPLRVPGEILARWRVDIHLTADALGEQALVEMVQISVLVINREVRLPPDAIGHRESGR